MMAGGDGHSTRFATVRPPPTPTPEHLVTDVDRRTVVGLGLAITTSVLPSAAAAASLTEPVITAPGAPTGLGVTVSTTADENGFYTVDVAWSEPSDDGGSTLTLYHHELFLVTGNNSAGGGTQDASVTVNTYMVDLTGDFEFPVRAENGAGLGPIASVAFTVPASELVPAPPA